MNESATLVETVRSLVDVMTRGGITELDVDYLDVRIRLRGASALAPVAVLPATAASTIAPVTLPPPAPVVGEAVTSPMVGTFYAAPTPQDPPFVQPGDRVRKGQIVGIIEAMKIMNEIASDLDGIVTEILVENAQPVEYGTELFRLASPSVDG